MADINEKDRSLPPVSTRLGWENMKGCMEDEQRRTPRQGWAPFLYEVFFTKDTEELLNLARSTNQVISALARSRVLYDGEAMGIPQEVREALDK